MKYSIDEAKYDLRQIQSDTTQFHRMVNVASIITKLMSQKVNTSDMPIIVGGFSLELYTVGKYTTHDIDFVTSASILMDICFLKLVLKKHRACITMMNLILLLILLPVRWSHLPMTESRRSVYQVETMF